MKHRLLCSLMCTFVSLSLIAKTQSNSSYTFPAWMSEPNPTPIGYTPPAPVQVTPAQLLTQLQALDSTDLRTVLSGLGSTTLLSVLAPAGSNSLPTSADPITNTYLKNLEQALSLLNTVITDTRGALPFNNTQLGKQLDAYLTTGFLTLVKQINS